MWEGKDHSKRQTIQGLSKLASSQLSLSLSPPPLITLCEYRCMLAEWQTCADQCPVSLLAFHLIVGRVLFFTAMYNILAGLVRFSRDSVVSTSCVAIDAHYCVCLLHGFCGPDSRPHS